ncbi:MAG: 16S rRNA (guanine(966)-N(2))-methyltransferase RsmD [Gemmatimonadetes bacterium]|nr:16S rRNA (guanine(966)-N(2))-methyltransferase RsmD [Gemmatimonadota bacterium]
MRSGIGTRSERRLRSPMRIVGGRWAGRVLTSPGGRVRPTAEELRERCMELLADDLKNARVLDLFAGTGALGLEALSRGAKSADFVENHASALHALKANVAALRARDYTRVFKKDVIPFMEALEEEAYDVAMADPPYESSLAERVVRQWLEVPFARVLLVEHARERALPGRGGKRSVAGDSCLTLFRARPTRR